MNETLEGIARALFKSWFVDFDPALAKRSAATIGLVHRYLVPGFDYPVSLLEAQKLVYFLQTAGEELKGVVFTRGHYGPYADVLRHVLGRLEGHYITGSGDGRSKPETPIRLLPGAGEEAIAFLAAHPDTRERFERVADLIEGFETPYGMELLATVHWVAAALTRLCERGWLGVDGGGSAGEAVGAHPDPSAGSRGKDGMV